MFYGVLTCFGIFFVCLGIFDLPRGEWKFNLPVLVRINLSLENSPG